MKSLLGFLLFILLTVAFSIESSAQLCVSPSQPNLDLNSIDFSDCSGFLTYDITSSSNGLNCTGCGPSIGPVTVSENIIVTAYEGGNECESININVVYLDASINYNAGSTPSCNEFTFNATTSSSVVGYAWDFNGDNVTDSNSATPTWQFSNNGNQTVSLTVFSSGSNCSYTTTENVFIDGPWADLSVFGNVDGDYEELNVISFGDDECTVPFCVDDIEDLHCLHLTGITHPNANGNTAFQIWVDGASVYSAATAPVDFEHCLPLDFSGYTTIEYQITDASGCVSFKTYELYVAEDSNPSASVEVDIPNTDGFCIGEFVEFEITADDSNPNDLTYIIAIDCPNLDFDEIVNPVMLDTLYLAPGEVYAGQWAITASSCNCSSGQFSIYTFMDSPCKDHHPGGTDPFTVNLDSQAEFDVPDVLCQDQSYLFSWSNADEMESGNCDADAIWSVQGPSDIQPIEVSEDNFFIYEFTEVGIYTVCLEIDADCQLVNSVICQDICVESVITSTSLDVIWPAVNSVSCVGDTYQPSVTLPAQFCSGLNYSWTVSPADGASVSGGNTANPTITFTDKGNFTIYVYVSSDVSCGAGSQNVSPFIIGAPPHVELNEASIGGCPDQPLCLDAAFCVDDCNTDFIAATVTIYQGSAGGGCDYSGLTEVWSASTDPVVGFPFDMLGMNCATTDFPCDFIWNVPNDADGNYVAVVEVENACGSDIQCTSINISPSVIPDDDITDSVCLGATVDPTLTNFSNCDWLVGGVIVWEPGDSPFVVNSTIDITISCSSSGCPFAIDHQIEVIDLPTLDIDGTTGICAGASTVLTANTDANQFEWYNLACNAINGGSVAVSNVNTYEVTAPGIYSVVVTNAAGCSTCEQVQVNIDLAPSFNCFPDSYCENLAATEIDLSCLTPPAGGWGVNVPSWNVDQGDNGVATDIASGYTVSNLLSDYSGTLDANTLFDFSYHWTSDLGCNYTDTVDIEILNEGVNNDSFEICTNEELSINGSGFGSWVPVDMPVSAGADFDGNTFNWTPADADAGGPYTLEFYPDGGCAYDIITIDVNLSPSVTLTINTDNNGESLCAGSSIDMEATEGFDTYVWYDNLCGAGSIIGGESTFDYSTSNSGNYSVLVTDLSGCSACDELTIQTDEGPNFACSDVVYCENEGDESLNLDCLTAPPGGWGLTDPPIWTNTLNGIEINSDIESPYSVQDILDDLVSELTVNSDFNLVYYWQSDSGCEYSDSLTFTIQNEGIDTLNVNICSGETIDITPDGSNGIWEIDALPAAADISVTPTNFIWNTIDGDIGGGNEMVFLSGSGCSSFQYYLEIFETPSGVITPEMDEMCLENQINVLLESDNVQYESLIYYYGIDSIILDAANPIFDPTPSGLNPGNDGLFSYFGWNDYPVPDGEILTCSFITTAPIEIVDFPESLFFPSTLCEGQEFAPTVCTDPYIDDFELTIDAILYTDCPLEFGELNGVVPYSLIGYYGGDLLCAVDTSGTIAIQEQLVIEFTSLMDSCTAEATVNFEVISGELNGISVSPLGEFVDDIPNQNIMLTIDDELNDQDYVFDFSIDDGGCDVLDFQFDGSYIAPLNPIIVIEEGPFCSGQEVNFELFQTGSNQVDSIVVNPGNGDVPYTWSENFNDPISFVYESPIDSTLMTIDFHLFNICHDTIVSEDFIIEPPELVVLIDPYFEGCPGVELDLTPQILGNYDDYQIIVDPDLSLGLVTPPFVFSVNDNQAPGIYDFQINFTPNCGDPITIFSEIEVFTVPETDFSFDVQCTGVTSVFSVDNPSINESYEWLIENQTQFGENTSFIFNSPGDYEVQLETTNLAGCSSTTSQIVTIGGIEIAMPFDPIGQCDDIQFDLNTALEPGQSVHWTVVNTSNNDIQEYFVNGQTVNFFNTSNEFIVNYQVILQVTDANNCSSTSQSTVAIYPDGSAEIEYYDGEEWNPTNGVFPIELNMDCSEEEFFFRDGTISNSCSWNSSINSCSQSAATSCPQFIYCANSDDDGWLSLTTINEYGCAASDEVVLYSTCGDSLIVFIPNAFTPNDDGVNDLFYVRGTNIDPDDFELLLFNRWGEVIYRSTDYTEYWLGNYQDSEYYVPDGVYNYLVKAHLKTNIKVENDNRNGEYKEYRGIVTILR